MKSAYFISENPILTLTSMNKAILLVTILFFSPLVFIAQDSLNRVDENGLKQGKWQKKFPKGQVRYEGQFRDDKPVGLFTYYFEEGGKSAEIQHLSEGAGSIAKFFHRNGVVMSEGQYENQEKTGEWKFYDDKGILSSVDYYKNGVQHGKSTVYYLNGQPSAEYNYNNGKRDGPFKEYYADGTLKNEGTYKAGEFEGTYTSYYEDGKIKMQGQYVNAMKDGRWVYYAPDGSIMAQEVYVDGEMTKQKVEEAYQKDRLVPVERDEDEYIDENEINPMQNTYDRPD